MLAVGMMDPGVIPRATFVGVQYLDGEISGPTTLPIAATGAVAGDYCMIFVTTVFTPNYAAIDGGSGGWNQDNYTWTPGYGYRHSTLHKKLDAVDMASTIRLLPVSDGGQFPVVVVVYRRPNRAVRKTVRYEDDGDTFHSTPGYVKASENIGTVGFIADRDTSGAITEAISGGAAVERLEHAATFHRIALADALGATDYPDSTPFVWSGLGNSGPYAEVSQLYELLI